MRLALFTALVLCMSSAWAGQHLVEGAPSSSVRVIIYEDLQCPDCADFRRMLDEQLLPRYGAKVTFEHRDFPLAKHAWARKAAIAARFFDITRTGLGLEWRKYALAHWSEITADSFNARLSAFAKEHSVDPAKAVAALGDPRLAAAVQSDFEEGVARGIAHTPTVLVNGQPFIEHFSVDEVAKAIDGELAAAR
jgi:protein-disulfide isomerase